jgi:hypothetical protein
MHSIVARQIDELIARYQGHPVATMALATAGVQVDHVRMDMRDKINEELPKPGGLLYVFADKAVNVQDTLFSRMTCLEPEAFEGILRPAFQHDEWKLIVAGGALGLVAGVLQLMSLSG